MRGVMATRLTSNQKILGSTPSVSVFFFVSVSKAVRVQMAKVTNQPSREWPFLNRLGSKSEMLITQTSIG